MKPDGIVVIMTNGPGHLTEIEAIRVAVFGPMAVYEVNHAFAPAVAAPILDERFDEVAWHCYNDTLAVTDAEDLMAFVTSTRPATEATPEQRIEIRRLIVEVMAANEERSRSRRTPVPSSADALASHDGLCLAQPVTYS